jgi:hypothetical protein
MKKYLINIVISLMSLFVLAQSSLGMSSLYTSNKSIINCEDAVIENFPLSVDDVCYGDSLSIDFSSVEIDNAIDTIWSIEPLNAGIIDSSIFLLNTNFIGSVTITLTAVAEPPCSDAVVSVTFTVHPLPEVECPDFDPICKGSDEIFFEGDGTYLIEGDTVSSFYPDTIGIFTFNYTEQNEFGCSATCTFDIIVNPIPVFDCPDYGPFCEGDPSVTFQGDGVYMFDNEIVTNFNPADAGTFTFTYTLTNSYNCESSCQFVINVNPIPQIDCPDYGPFCEGDEPIEFDNEGLYTFEGEIVTGFNPVEAGIYTFTYYTDSNAYDCVASCEFIIIVNSIPSCPEYGPYCEGDAVVNLEGEGVYTYEGDTLSIFDPSEVGAFTLMYEETNVFGCALTCTFTILVFPSPIIDCPEYGPVCEGDSAIVFQGDGIYIYDDEVVTSFLPVSAGTYTFTYSLTNVFNCATDCQFNILVNPLPQIECPEYGPFCEGDDPIEFNNEGFYTFEDEIVSGFDPIEAGIYTITYFTDPNTFDCVASCEFYILVNQLPECPEYGPYCEGDSIVNFEEEGVFIFQGDTIFGFDPVDAGLYTFEYFSTNSFGCEISCIFDIIVEPIPMFECPDYGPFCKGDDEVTFEGEGIYLFGEDTVTGFNPSESGFYNFVYTETNEFGCSSTCEFVIEVNPMLVCPNWMQFFITDNPIILDTVHPQGGVYSGDGVFYDGSNYYFDPSIGLGTYEIEYDFTSANSCNDICVFSINVSLEFPILKSPDNASVDRMPDVILNWNPVINASNYQVQVSDSEDFIEIILDSISSFTAVRTSRLNFGMDHFWRVRTIFANGETSEWSDVWSFETFSKINLFRPQDASDDENPDVLLRWNPRIGSDSVKGVTYYVVQIDTAGSFDSPFVQQFTTAGDVYEKQMEELYFGTVYHWRAKTGHALYESDWSDVRTFSTLNQIDLKRPNNSSTGNDLNVLLRWDNISGLTRYEYQIDDNENFSSPSVDLTENFEQNATGLLYGTTYYWRIRGRHSLDTTAWSEVWNFATAASVNLTSPADGDTAIVLRPQLQWSQIKGSTRYEINYSNDESTLGDNAHFRDASDDEIPHFNVNFDLEPNTLYYWRIRAISPIDTSNYSNVSTFTTLSPISVNEYFKEAALAIFPNPAQDMFSVQMNISEQAEVELYLYDLLGQVVLSRKLSFAPGFNQSNIVLDNVANGIYLLKLNKGDQVYTNKLVISK